MGRVKTVNHPERVIWRMTQANPRGELVRVSGLKAGGAPRCESVERGCAVSSLELLSGADVDEMPMDTLPGELIDAFAPDRPETEI